MKQINCRNFEKAQESAIFVRKRLKVNMLRIKDTGNLGTIVITEMDTEVLHIAYII